MWEVAQERGGKVEGGEEGGWECEHENVGTGTWTWGSEYGNVGVGM